MKKDKIILIDDKLVINAKLLKYINKNKIDFCYNPYNQKVPLNIYEKQIWVGSVYPIYYKSALSLMENMEYKVSVGKATRKYL